MLLGGSAHFVIGLDGVGLASKSKKESGGFTGSRSYVSNDRILTDSVVIAQDVGDRVGIVRPIPHVVGDSVRKAIR